MFTRAKYGLRYIKWAKKYRAQIVSNGKKINLGYFEDAEDAHNAYLKAKNELHIIEELDNRS